MKINSNYEAINDSYLFSTIAKKVAEYKKYTKDKVISLGIGDVTLPLPSCVIESLNKAVLDMSVKETFKGYGPEQGYAFLRESICDYYQKNNVVLDSKEVFISDGAKSDLGNILDLFDIENKVLIPNPVYPVYVDTNIMAGRKVTYLDANEENGFLPMPDRKFDADIIYICSPNNPTGAAYNKEQLKQWVDYALEKRAVILFDAAYEAFIEEENIPKSIYQIEGAKKCAIEFCSLSKTAGFTGLRCGYTIVPHELGKLNSMWVRRQTTKFNGVPYIVQVAAKAVFDNPEEINTNIKYYKENAKIITTAFDKLNVWYIGGKNSPYIWIKIPNNMSSWEFFDFLLTKANVVGTPGVGFGKEGFFRFSSFGDREDTIKAIENIQKIL